MSVDRLVGKLRGALIEWGTHRRQYGRREELLAALDELAALARERDSVLVTLGRMAERAEAAEGDRDAALDREIGTSDALDAMRADRDRLQARVTELKAALEAAKHELGHVTQTPAEAASAALAIVRAALAADRSEARKLPPSTAKLEEALDAMERGEVFWEDMPGLRERFRAVLFADRTEEPQCHAEGLDERGIFGGKAYDRTEEGDA